jgi:hypothetical protein
MAGLAQTLDDAPPGPQGPPGPAGKLPSVRVWKAGQVSYENEVFAYEGGCYQALRDTAQEPGGSDWVQITRAGRDGIIPQLRGTYDPKESYKRFDIVALNGSSFIARKDDPGECPGSGWQLHASAGRSGGRGERGEQGPRGMQGYTATPILSGGGHHGRAMRRTALHRSIGQAERNAGLSPRSATTCAHARKNSVGSILPCRISTRELGNGSKSSGKSSSKRWRRGSKRSVPNLRKVEGGTIKKRPLEIDLN